MIEKENNENEKIAAEVTESKTIKDKVLAAIGNDMRNFAIICFGAGIFETVLRNEQSAIGNLLILMGFSFVIWVCGIVLTTITQK